MLTVCSTVVTVCLSVASPAEAQQIDVTVFLGRAYPVYDERLTIRPSVPSLPGVEVGVSGDPLIRADGGLVVGGALAFELGIVGIEARIDGTEVGFDLTGARYDLRATQSPFAGLSGSVTVGNGRFDANRFFLLSGNLRVRTPGPVALVASGGLSVLPDVSIGGSVPIAVQIPGLPAFPGIEPRLQLRVAPGESEHRIGVNGGAGLRLGGDRIGILAEVRAFYFREYDLRFDVEGAPEFVATLLENADTIGFRPVIVNAQAGLVFRF
jgi:hypothetical protein